jgi:hypothetical protein
MSDIIRGKNQAERNASIEHALRSIARKATKRATVYIPPIPLSSYCGTIGEDKIIGRMMVPFSGTIRDVYLRIGEMNKEESKVSLSIISDVAETKLQFTVTKKMQKLDVEMPISAGTALIVALEEGDISDILVGIAIYINLETTRAKQYLLEEILGQEKEEEEEKEEEQEDALQNHEEEERV